MRKANRYRPHQVHLMLTEEEYSQIKERAEAAKIGNLSAYLRKMAIDGYVINVELKEVIEAVRLLRYSSNNLNQIAKHANETGSIYKDDVEEMQKNYKDLWGAMRELLQQINKITKV